MKCKSLIVGDAAATTAKKSPLSFADQNRHFYFDEFAVTRMLLAIRHVQICVESHIGEERGVVRTYAADCDVARRTSD